MDIITFLRLVFDSNNISQDNDWQVQQDGNWLDLEDYLLTLEWFSRQQLLSPNKISGWSWQGGILRIQLQGGHYLLAKHK